MNDKEFDDLFSGEVINPDEVKGITFQFSLYYKDQLVFTKKSVVTDTILLGTRGETHTKTHDFTIRWSRV